MLAQKWDTTVYDRLDTFELQLEKKLSIKISNIVNKRINSEVKKVNLAIDLRVDKWKEGITSDVDILSSK